MTENACDRFFILCDVFVEFTGEYLHFRITFLPLHCGKALNMCRCAVKKLLTHFAL